MTRLLLRYIGSDSRENLLILEELVKIMDRGSNRPVCIAMASTRVLAIGICLSFIFASSPLALCSANSTMTTLSVSSGSLAAGTPLTMTATVTGSLPTPGQVTFCDATASHCDGPAIFGVAQVTSNGTAAITRTLGVGQYSIQAVFTSTIGSGGSISVSQAVTVTGAGNYGSNTAIAASGGVGDYTLTATVTAFGRTPATGTLSFLDTSYGSDAVASAVLNPATLATVFNPAPGSPISDNSARFVVSADFNGDGIPDLAIANLTVNGTISVFVGKGDGTFQSAVNYSVGVNPQMLAVADVNNDGAPDLIVANECAEEACDTSSVSVLLGNGDGTFRMPISFEVGCYAAFVAVGDFNRDGWPDLAIVNQQEGKVSILLGTGDTTLFGSPSFYPVGSLPEGIAIGDFNQDGRLDLAVSNSGDGTVSLLFGNGDGTFQSQQIVSLPSSVSPYWLASADLRNIGTVDLVVPDVGSSNKVYVLLGNGDGSFQPAVEYPVDVAPDGVSIGDINGDGILDLVVPNTGGEQVSVLLGDGTGAFAPKTDYTVGTNPTFVALADFNGDGQADIATSDSESSTATILLQAHTEKAIATAVAVFPAGTHNVLASYPGDANHKASVSNTVALMGSSPTPTSTALSAGPNPAFFGKTVTLVATITPVPNGSTLGTVSFYNGSNLIGNSNLNSSGVATFSTTSLPVGVDNLTAVYSGNVAFASSASNVVPETITALTNTTTTLEASPNPATVLQTVSLAATVAPLPNGSPLGTVSFYNGSDLIGNSNLNSSGVATFSTTSLPVGVDNLTAVYSGNSAFAASTSNVVPETINNLVTPSTFAVTTLETSVTVTQSGSVNIDVSVLPVGGAFDNVVTMSSTGLPAGATASFNPPTAIPGSSGAPTLLTVQMASPTSRSVDPGKLFGSMALAIGLCGMGFTGKHFSRRFKRILRVISLACLGSTLIACAGNGFLLAPSTPSTQPASNAVYVVTITGTSGSMQASTTVSLEVQ